MKSAADALTGIVKMRSHHSGLATMERLESLLKKRGLTVFARIDFSGDAERVGLSMRFEQLLIFGNPKAGTPLMRAVPTVGLDLPLKALVWEDDTGTAWLAYVEPGHLVARNGLPPELAENLAAVLPVLESAIAG